MSYGFECLGVDCSYMCSETKYIFNTCLKCFTLEVVSIHLDVAREVLPDLQ